MKDKTDDLQNISGKRVLISGGTTGIGRAAALTLASHGARIIYFGRHRQQIDETMAAISSLKRKTESFGMVADVGYEKDISKVFGVVDSQFGGLDIMINNAALPYQSIMEGTYQDWQYVVNTNLLGYMACCNEAITRMRGHSGHIVNIGSMSADIRERNSSVYVATKSAIQGFSEALRKEINPLGIKVSLIEPGATDTDMQEDTSQHKKEKVEALEMLQAQDVAEAILYCVSQPLRTDVVNLQLRPHLQII